MQTNKIDIRDQYNKRLNKAKQLIRIQLMIDRLSQGLKLSRNDLRELKNYLANTRENT